MNRKYTIEQFISLVNYIRKQMPNVAITTDYIVAYSSETEKDFKDSITNLKRLKFANMNIFIYSRRKGTVADLKYPKDVNSLIARNRYNQVYELRNQCQKQYLESLLGIDVFRRLFPIILTDNGSEFGNPLSLEFNEEGIGRTRIFYCNPRASYQKGMLEKNHEFIRYVLPKGTSFDGLLQTDINLMINHINSLGRNSLNWFAPIDVAKFTLDKEILKKLNLSKIPNDKIQLNKKLLKKN